MSEWMEEVPLDLDAKWLFVPCPTGKRCLLITEKVALLLPCIKDALIYNSVMHSMSAELQSRVLFQWETFIQVQATDEGRTGWTDGFRLHI